MKRNHPARRCHLEHLEPRSCPASLAPIVLAGDSLYVSGTADADHIQLDVNDLLDQITVRMTTRQNAGAPTGATPIVREFPSSRIRNLVIKTGSGNDHVEFHSLSAVQCAKRLAVALGEGDDLFEVRLSQDAATNVPLRFEVAGDAGRDSLFANLGSVGATGSLSVSGTLGTGDDTATVIAADVAGRFDLQLRGEAGHDSLALRTLGEVSTTGSWTANLQGGDGRDTLTADLDSTNRGTMHLDLRGGSGDDSLGLSARDSSERTRSRWSLSGEGGNDSLRVDFGNSETLIGLPEHRAAIADGGSGRDRLTAPPDVSARGIEERLSAASWRTVVAQAAAPLLSQLENAGVFVGILNPNGSRELYSFGQATANGTDITARTPFEIGSITKTFTTTLLADMVARGEVSLDDPVAQYLPADAAMPTRGGRAITLVELATHTSGLPRDTLDFERKVAAVMQDLQLGIEDEEHITALLQAEAIRDWSQLRRDLLEVVVEPVDSPAPDYSNLGMGLLGLALSRRLGLSYEEAIRQRVLEPLGLPDVFQAITPAREPQQANGYFAGERPVPPMRFDTLAGAGALRSSGLDLLRYMEAQSGRFPTSLAGAMGLAQTPRVDWTSDTQQVAIGLGWLIEDTPFGRTVWHDGATWGFTSHFQFNVATGAGFVVLVNTTLDGPSGPALVSFVEGLASAIVLTSQPTPPAQSAGLSVQWESLLGLIAITGTTSDDNVDIQWNRSQRSVVVTSRLATGEVAQQWKFFSDAVNGVRADLRTGIDQLTVDTQGQTRGHIGVLIQTTDRRGRRVLLLGTDGASQGEINTELVPGRGADRLMVTSPTLSWRRINA